MSESIKKDNQSDVFKDNCCPLIETQIGDTIQGSNGYEMSDPGIYSAAYLSANVWPSIQMSYFNGFCQQSNQQSVQICDMLASIEGKLFEYNSSNNRSMEVMQRSNEIFENYLKLRENHFLNKLKETEKRVEDKLDSIAADVKNANKRLQNIEDLFQKMDSKLESNSNEMRKSVEKLEKCVTTFLSTDSSVRSKSLSTKGLSYQQPFRSPKDWHQINSFCEPIANKLREELRSVITNCFDDFKKTIIDQKIIEIIGDKTDSTHDSSETQVILMRNGQTDPETLRIKALDLLNASKITQSFRIALSLCDSEFVSHLCTVFQHCPQKLFAELQKCKDSQNLFIDLLDQLIDSGVIDANKRWKIPLIARLILRIDMKSSISKSSVPRLADHWCTVMESVAKMGGEHSEKARLLALSLVHFSSLFY